MQTKTPLAEQPLPATSLTILKECAGLASSLLPASIKAALDKVDDALFELANRSNSSPRQNVYFDAMRELRLKRGGFEAEFMRNLHCEFENSLDLAKAQGFAGTVSYGKALGLLTRAKANQAVEDYAECVDTASRARFFIAESRKGR